jgi:taurine dioxygenase
MAQAQYQLREATAYTQIRVEPLTGMIGAEIHDIDLRNNLSDAVMAEVERALLEWRVIFFREQDISTDDHLRFARWFGTLEVHPFAPHKPDYPEVLAITHDEQSPGRENLWHSDVTWRLQPSLGSVLRAIEVPPYGGDTLFSDMNAAYERLSDDVKAKIDGARAVHDFGGFRRRLIKEGASPEEIEAFNAKYPNPSHPVVRTHPATGERSLYVNRAFTQYIEGMPREDSDALLQTLYAQAATPEYQCRFRWAKNSIAFWDNRAVQHYAAADYWPARRQVERVTICGDTPV